MKKVIVVDRRTTPREIYPQDVSILTKEVNQIPFIFFEVSGQLYIAIGNFDDKIPCPFCSKIECESVFIGRSGKVYEVGTCKACEKSFIREVLIERDIFNTMVNDLVKVDWQFTPKTLH